MLDIKRFALALGVTWGLSNLILGWIAISGWGFAIVHVLSSLYIGFDATFVGGIIGGIWGFVDGAIGGFLISFFYNFFGKKAKK